MAILRLEMSSTGDDWSPVGELRAGDQYGSLSDELDDGTSHIYMFGINPIENVAEIRRSIGGIDITRGDARHIDSIGLEVVADLAPGEQHELMIKTRRSPAAKLIRFTHLDA